MSDADVARTVVAVLLAGLPSLVAPVVPVNVFEPGAVGVPETVQTNFAPGAMAAGAVGEHDVVRPAGRPVMAQVAPLAASAGAGAFVQLKVPL